MAQVESSTHHAWRAQRKSIRRLVAISVLTGAAGLATTLLAQAQNFSGKYSVQDRKGKSVDDRRIEVVQNESLIEVTEIDHGEPTTNRYPLDGSESDYVTPSGIRGECKARQKGKQVILESVVLAQPQGAAQLVREHTLQRWQLSSDSRVLTIQTEVDFPDFPPGISAAVADTTSGKERYVRIESH